MKLRAVKKCWPSSWKLYNMVVQKYKRTFGLGIFLSVVGIRLDRDQSQIGNFLRRDLFPFIRAQHVLSNTVEHNNMIRIPIFLLFISLTLFFSY